MGSKEGNAIEQRRIGGRLRAWLARRWTKRGLAVLLVAVLILLAAASIAEPWRWLLVADGSVITWLGLAMLAGPGQRGWPRAFARGAAVYVLPTLILLVSGAPPPLAAAWPFALVQAGLACPMGLACPLGR